MNHFSYRDGEMHAEGVSIGEIAEQVGTPFYCYSAATLERHFTVFDESFTDADHLVCFSVKANSNLAVLALFAGLGSGFDIVSGGELARVLAAGGDASKVVYSGVGKTAGEIRAAIDAGIMMFNVESEGELDLIDRVAGEAGKKAPIALRVNPNVDPKTHPYISTGMKKNKFGIAFERALEVYDKALAMTNVKVVGIDCHIGSQLTDVTPFVDSIARLKNLIGELRGLIENSAGKGGTNADDFRYLDLGGGLGITYDNEAPPHPEDYARAVIEATRELGLTLVFEPGRVIVGNAGILVTRCLYNKESDEKNFCIVDAAMNDLMRPSLYGSFQEVVPVKRAEGREDKVMDVVGPICESGDFFAKDRRLTRVESGELLAIMSAGAYGFTMSSNYNTRPRAAEVMVHGERFALVREREKAEDLFAGENPKPFA